MKIKMNPEETAQMLKAFEHPHFTNTVNYVTAVEVDPDWVREVLPAPLEPDAPVVTFALSQGDQFTGLVCGLQCKYDDLVGSWGLSYTMDTDLAIIYGREGLAEPKKLGTVVYTVENGKYVGTVSRFGTELIHIEAEIGEEVDGSAMKTMENFHFKYAIKADGSGITDVDLIHSHFDTTVTDIHVMKPTKIELTDTPFDMYGTIPVKKVLSGFYGTFDMVGSAKYLAQVDAGAFLPYAFFKHDDYRMTMDVAD